MNRRTVAALVTLAVAAVVAGLLLAVGAARTVDGHGHHPSDRAVTFDGTDLRYTPTAWSADCDLVNFDVHYADGREPFLSTLRLCTPAHFVPNPAPASTCGRATWFVYRGEHLEQPGGADVIAHGTTTDCEVSPTSDR